MTARSRQARETCSLSGRLKGVTRAPGPVTIGQDNALLTYIATAGDSEIMAR